MREAWREKSLQRRPCLSGWRLEAVMEREPLSWEKSWREPWRATEKPRRKLTEEKTDWNAETLSKLLAESLVSWEKLKKKCLEEKASLISSDSSCLNTRRISSYEERGLTCTRSISIAVSPLSVPYKPQLWKSSLGNEGESWLTCYDTRREVWRNHSAEKLALTKHTPVHSWLSLCVGWLKRNDLEKWKAWQSRLNAERLQIWSSWYILTYWREEATNERSMPF